jgi:hypothetical protein
MCGIWKKFTHQIDKKIFCFDLHIPDNFDNNIREPFLKTLISIIQSRFEDADVIDQLAILDLTWNDLIECMYGYTEIWWH